MLVNFRFTLRVVFLCAVALAALLIALFLSISLVAFQKAAMLAPVDTMDVFLTGSAESSRSAPDVRQLLEPIPYRDSGSIFDVLPQDRFHKTIKTGRGNCSNLSFGMAFLLLQRSYAFQVVHIIPYDGLFSGTGHTVLDMSYIIDGVTHRGLVDILEGGLPRVKDSFIDLPTLLKKHLDQPAILPLNVRKDVESAYYGNFLEGSAVGVVPRDEIARYFSFINRIYIPLGNKRLERIIYSGVAIVFGYYPHSYVSQEDYARLFAGKSYLIWAAQALIWLLRLIPLLLLFSLLFYVRRAKSLEAEADSNDHITGNSLS